MHTGPGRREEEVIGRPKSSGLILGNEKLLKRLSKKYELINLCFRKITENNL